MAKKCPPGKYYCFTDKKCKKIPFGYRIGARGYLARDTKEDDSETKKNGNGSSNGNGNGGNGAGNGNGGAGGNGGGNGGGGMGESIVYETSNPRIPRKKGQPAKSKKHSDLYTDEDPKGTIHGLGFKNVAKARASVSKIRNSSRSHAHKIQAAVAMEQRAREMGKTSEAAVYRKYINAMKKKTKKMNEAANPAQQAAIAIDMKKKGKKPKNVKEALDHSVAVTELEDGLKNLKVITYDSVDQLMQGIAKRNGISETLLHNQFKAKHFQIPDDWAIRYRMNKTKGIEEEKMTSAQKRKDTMLKKKYDKSDMKKSMQDQYGKEEGKKVYFATIRKQAMEEIDKYNIDEEGLRDWFGKSSGTTKSGRKVRGWVQVGGKYDGKPCARQPGQKSTPKCVSSSKRRSMSKKERDSAARRKRAADPNQPQKSGAAKPTNVSTDPKRKMKEQFDGQKSFSQLRVQINEIDQKGLGFTALNTALNVAKFGKKVFSKLGRKINPPEGLRITGREAMGLKRGRVSTPQQDLKIQTQSIKNQATKASQRSQNKLKMMKQTSTSGKDLSKNVTINPSKISGKELADKYIGNTTKSSIKKKFSGKRPSGTFKDDPPPPNPNPQNLPKNKLPESTQINEAKDKKGKGSGTKDACYHKVKSRYSVWPSAYASGALVKCRKVGAANWGNKTKKEGFSPMQVAALEVAGMIEINEAGKKCWKGYEKKGTQTLFGKTYNRCVKKKATKESVEVSELANPLPPPDKDTRQKPNPNQKPQSPYEPGKSPFKLASAKLPVLNKNVKMVTGIRKGVLPLSQTKITNTNSKTLPEEVKFLKKKESKSKYTKERDAGKLAKKVMNKKDQEKVNFLEPEETNESKTRLVKNGHTYKVVLTWRGKTYMIQMFVPSVSRPTRQQVEKEIQKVYPDAKLMSFLPKDLEPGEPTVMVGEELNKDDKPFVKKLVGKLRKGSKTHAKQADDLEKAMSEEMKRDEYGDPIGGPKISKKEKEKNLKKNEKDEDHTTTTAEEYVTEDDMKGMSVKSGHKRPTKAGAGMTQKGVEAYRRRNPGSKLKTAVTGKVKKGSKDAKRRKSYCARSAGQMKKFPKAAKDPNSRLRQARRRWKC